MNSYFVIVERGSDRPLFEAEFFRPDYLTKLENERALHQFIVHAALDMVESIMWSVATGYLRVVDRYGEWLVSAQIAPTGDRLILLHDGGSSSGGSGGGSLSGKNEEGIKSFFAEVNELYSKYRMNPFAPSPGEPIDSGPFEVKVRILAKRHLHK